MAISGAERDNSLRLLLTAQSERFLPVREDPASQIGKFVYHSPTRPFWVGFDRELDAESGFVGYGSAMRLVEARRPVPVGFLNRFELLPVSMGALRELAGQIAEGQSQICLRHSGSQSQRLALAWIGFDGYTVSEFDVSSPGEPVLLAESAEMPASEAILFMTEAGYGQYTADRYTRRYLNVPVEARRLVREIAVMDSGLHPALPSGTALKGVFEPLLSDDAELAGEIADFIDANRNEWGVSDSRLKQLSSVLRGLPEADQVSGVKRKWIDLSQHGIYLADQRMADGRTRLIVLDMNNIGRPADLAQIGFMPVQGSPRYAEGIYYLKADDQRLRPKALAGAFGIDACPIVDVDPPEILKVFQERMLEKFGSNLNSVVLRSRPLGQNSDGQNVYESAVGRFIRLSDNNAVSEGSASGSAYKVSSFLRATNDQELRECADGFLWKIRNGSKASWSDLTSFARTVFSTAETDNQLPAEQQLHRLQEALEAAAYRHFSQSAQTPDEAAFKAASDVYYGLPAARMRTAESIHLQQFSTPLPMSVVAQKLLIGRDVVTSDRPIEILEPTAGNGGLLGLLPAHAKIHALELDPKRHEALAATNRINARIGDATTADFRADFDVGGGFDYTIANPPFGQMDLPQAFDKLSKVRRLDHYIGLRTLAARKEQGRSVLIFAADSAQSNGEVKGSARGFLNYLHDHYHVEGLAEVDGRLYSRNGAGYNIRVMVIGDKRANPIEIPVPEKLEVITSYDDFWLWSENVIDRSSKLSSSLSWEADDPVISADSNGTGRFGYIAPVFDTEIELPVETATIPAAPAPAPAPAILKAEIERADQARTRPLVERRVNEYQAPYQSASKSGDPSSMIPINMAGATYAALNDLENRFGPIDEYVAAKLQYEVSELHKFFSPEQIDAVGLAIKSVEEGRGIINADQTGLGKGRFVAAMARYAVLNEKIPVFLTIKPELFTDIFRDISDIGSQHLFKKLFIFNDGENVKKYGTEKEVLYRATTPAERKAALSSGEVEPGTDMVLATYSQFMRVNHKNPKAGLLVSLASNNAMLILDEAHVASGASNLSATVGEAVANSDAVLYASATPLKGVSNFAIYNKVFPASVDLMTLPDTLLAGGEALQEAISTNMARDGVLIRREHDFSQLTFHTRDPSAETRLKNVKLADDLSEIVAGLSYLSGDVARVVADMNKGYKKEWEDIPDQDRQGSRMQASSMNFGSRLYSLNRQFLLGIKIEDAVEASLVALREGRKPVIAVENTGESLLRQVISRRAGIEPLEAELLELDEKVGSLTAEEKDRRDTLVATINEALRDIQLENPPQYRELLESMLDRIGIIKVQGRYGDVRREAPQSDEYHEAAESLRVKIQAFPDLPLTPIDVIKKELDLRGFSVGEVSGRKASIVPNSVDHEKWDVKFHNKSDAVANVAGFQNGKYDSIVITRSGSTGISLHATDRFEDSDVRQRDFIVLQKASNIAEFLQWLGRVNRKDQIIPPVITSLETGLPAELRLTMMHNAKLRKLSANTTSNRDNANLEGEELDLLNDVGDRVALEWLVENPDVASYLDIALPSDDDIQDVTRFGQECPYVNKLMGRLMMLQVAKQEDILRTLTHRFADKLEELEQRGENPFKVTAYDWKATSVHQEELQSGVIRSSGSTFDAPVKIVTLQYEKDVYPIRSEKLLDLIKAGNSRLADSGVLGDNNSIKEFKSNLRQMRDSWVRKQLPSKYRDSDADLNTLLEGKDVMGAKNARDRADWIIANLEAFKPGVKIAHDDMFKGETFGVITAVEFPRDIDEAFLLSRYRAKVAFPGDEKTRELTLAAIYNQSKSLAAGAWFAIEPESSGARVLPYIKRQIDELLSAFDTEPDGKVVRTQYVLQGNIFRACELANSQKMGSPILYTDENGDRLRAVLLKDRVTPDMVKSIPIGLDARDVADYIEEFLDPSHADHHQRSALGGVKFFDAPVKDMERGKGISFALGRNRDCFDMIVPGTKSRAGALLADGAIFQIGESTPASSLGLKLAGDRSAMSVSVPRILMPLLLERLQRGHHVGKFYIPSPDQETLSILKERFARGATRDAGPTGHEM